MNLDGKPFIEVFTMTYRGGDAPGMKLTLLVVECLSGIHLHHFTLYSFTFSLMGIEKPHMY